MNNTAKYKDEVLINGFTVVENIYSKQEIDNILEFISQADSSNQNFRKSNDLFAIRQFLKEIPEIAPLIFNQNLRKVIDQLFGENYFVVKSIYFDKPGTSNWFVSYHQDLTISVDKKINLANFGPWTTKNDQYAVQPPIEILKNIYTVRIHLDNTDQNNGALKVISKSHLKDIYRPETIDWSIEKEISCNVPEGGIMIMKPLLLHSSNRTTNNKKRRVIHLEFSNCELPESLKWAERDQKAYT